MKKVIILILCNIVLSVYAQTDTEKEFNEFLKRFPSFELEDLDSIKNTILSDHRIADSIPVAIANRNLWYDYSAPRTKHWEYGKSDNYGVYVFSNEDTIVPVANIKINDSICMLIVYFRREYYPEEMDQNKNELDAIVYNLKDQQMRSNFVLNSLYKDDVIIEDNYNFTEFVGNDDETVDDFDEYRIKFQLQTDGHLKLIENKYVTTFECEVKDADGYVNIREAPDINSKILYTIASGIHIRVYKLPGSQWGQVVRTKGGKNGGYIHLSRLCNYKKFYEWGGVEKYTN